MKKLIIFGEGKIAQAVSYFFNRSDSDYNICAYIADEAYIQSTEYLGKPLVTMSEVTSLYPKENYSVFVAVGYQKMNELRESKFNEFKNLGYQFAQYRSPFVAGQYALGENSIVMDGAVVQPEVTIGHNSFVWGGTMIGHHAKIGNHCWITGSCAIGGVVTIDDSCFVGLNATISNEINIGKKCMLGANSATGKCLNDESVVICPDTPIHRLNSTQLSRFSTSF